MSAISRRFERAPIPYALETDCPLGAAGFEPLHLMRDLRQDSPPRGQDSKLCISKFEVVPSPDVLEFGVT